MICRIVDLRCKEVINVCDGARLGYTYDVEIDQITGRVVAIIVQGPGRVLGGLIGHGDEFVISWENVKRIGDDIILVDQRGCQPCPKKRGR